MDLVPSPSAAVSEVRGLYAAFDAFEHAVARALGLARSDLRCVALLETSATPTSLADRLGLTTSAMTAMLDRLERSGWITRRRREDDRRSLTVTLVPAKFRKVGMLYGRMAFRVGEAFGDGATETKALAIARNACELATLDVVSATTSTNRRKVR